MPLTRRDVESSIMEGRVKATRALQDFKTTWNSNEIEAKIAHDWQNVPLLVKAQMFKDHPQAAAEMEKRYGVKQNA